MRNVQSHQTEPVDTGARRPKIDPSFTHPFWNSTESGTYRCANCGARLFGSEKKYDSCTGWPSFWAPLTTTVLNEATERVGLFRRTRVTCAICDSHLGYLFRDGPNPTGLRYCINGSGLSFEPE